MQKNQQQKVPAKDPSLVALDSEEKLDVIRERRNSSVIVWTLNSTAGLLHTLSGQCDDRCRLESKIDDIEERQFEEEIEGEFERQLEAVSRDRNALLTRESLLPGESVNKKVFFGVSKTKGFFEFIYSKMETLLKTEFYGMTVKMK